MVEFGSHNVKEEDLKSNVGGSWCALKGGGGHLVILNENPARFLMSKEGAGTKSQGARRHQGGTKEAPRRHQGGTKEA